MFSCQDWNKFLVADQEMALSYEMVGDLKRSWMKKYIACLFSFYGHDSRIEHAFIARQRAGFVHEKVSVPVSRAVIFAESDPETWNRLLAAVIPAIAAGTGEICVFLIKNQEESSPELLTSLELAGIENIFLNDRAQAGTAAGMISNSADTAIIDLCSRSPVEDIFSKSPANIQKYIRLSFADKPRALIWTERSMAWNYEIMRWAHPDMEFTVGGPFAHEAPEGFAKIGADVHEALEQPYDLFLGDVDIFRTSRIARGFSRGMEPFWLWPEIGKSFFTVNRVYWKEIA